MLHVAGRCNFVDIARFKDQLRKGLAGLSFVGMIEPALYVNVAPGTKLSIKRAVSWHLHAICWGESRLKMKQAVSSVEPGCSLPFTSRQPVGAHQKQIPNSYLGNSQRTFFADKLRYMLKSPQKAYRIYKTAGSLRTVKFVPCFRQKKSELRNGDRITLFHLMKGLYLDELAMAVETASTCCAGSSAQLFGWGHPGTESHFRRWNLNERAQETISPGAKSFSARPKDPHN